MVLFPKQRETLKQRLGWAPRPTHPAPVVARAQPGQREFSFRPLLQYNPTEIYVAVDKVRMTENHDYEVDWGRCVIRFNPDVQRLDGGEEIEIRSTGPDVDPLREIVLLPRTLGGMTFTDEQLEGFMSDVVGNVFELAQLARYEANKAKLTDTFLAAAKTIQVKRAEIRPEGIVGTEQAVIVIG